MKNLRALYAIAAVTLAGAVFAACSDAPTSPQGPTITAKRTVTVVKDTAREQTVTSEPDQPVVCDSTFTTTNGVTTCTCRGTGVSGSGNRAC